MYEFENICQKWNSAINNDCRQSIGGFQPISRDTDDNGEMYKCWWTNKRG